MFKKRIEITDYNIISYTDFNNTLVISNIKKHLEPRNEIYHLHNDTINRLPSHMTNKWLKLQLVKVNASSLKSSDDIPGKWYARLGKRPTKFTSNYYFKIIGVYNTEKEAKSYSVINGFRKTIDDNKYFSAIPKVNEISHLDNGIIPNVTLLTAFKVPEDPNKWDRFKITHKTQLDYNKDIIKMADRGHEAPAR